MARITSFLLSLGLATTTATSQSPRDLHNHLMERAQQAFAKNAARREELIRGDAEGRKLWQQGTVVQMVRTLQVPISRSPLKARTVRTVQRTGYRVENVLFDSRPGFTVSANLYLPMGDGPHAAVIVPCGHTQNGKAGDLYQLGCILLATNGIAALCFDPIGQGERKQWLDAAGKRRFHATEEHMVLGAGCSLLGEGLAGWMVWDAIRAIDYLENREEIDPTRIGCAGNSGGGTQTAYLMAVDDRLAAAAPSCYLCGFEDLLSTIGPQDAEQNIYGQLALGVDHADYVSLRTPLPTLICAATDDFFPIEGTWKLFRTAKRWFAADGVADRLDIVEVAAKHGWHRPLREAMARFMVRHLDGRDEDIVDPGLSAAPEADVLCTPQGQVVLLDESRSIIEIQADMASRLRKRRGKPTADAIRKCVGLRTADEIPAAKLSPGEITADAEGRTVVPIVAVGPSGVASRMWRAASFDGIPTLLLDDRPLTNDRGLAPHVYAALELLGIGATQYDKGRGDYAKHAGANWPTSMLAHLLGASLVQLRVEQIVAMVKALETPVLLEARGEACVPALHAAALYPKLFTAVKLDGGLHSYESAFDGTPPRGLWVQVVHGALKVYDLPDLIALVEPRITITNPVNANGQPRR